MRMARLFRLAVILLQPLAKSVPVLLRRRGGKANLVCLQVAGEWKVEKEAVNVVQIAAAEEQLLGVNR